MPTRLLFRDDFYLSTCEATVTAVHDDGAIEFDQTCFYATSGGQPGDTGFLERADGSRIALDVTVTGDTTVIGREHLEPMKDGPMPANPGPFGVGDHQGGPGFPRTGGGRPHPGIRGRTPVTWKSWRSRW